MLVTDPTGRTPARRSSSPSDHRRHARRGLGASSTQLHAAGISHGNLDASRILVDRRRHDRPSTTSRRPTPPASEYWRNRDVAAVLVDTAQLVGNERAIAAGGRRARQGARRRGHPVRAAGRAPRRHRRGREAPRQGAQGAARRPRRPRPASRTPRRSRSSGSAWSTSGCSPASSSRSCIAFHSIEGIDWASVKGEFENADLGVGRPRARRCTRSSRWRGPPRCMGCVNKDLPFVPTVLTQLACTFLNLITPNGIGGTALQLDYLHKQGVPVASGGERDGAQHRGRRRDPDDPVPRRRGDHRDRGRHQQQLLRQHQPAASIAVGRGADRDRPRHPEDPRQGRARGEAGRRATSGRSSATRGRRCSSSAATSPAT